MSKEVSIKQLPQTTEINNDDLLLVQTPSSTNTLLFKNLVLGADNLSFDIGTTDDDGIGSKSGTGFSLTNCKETTVGSLKIKTGEMTITTNSPVDVEFPNPYASTHLTTMFTLKESTGADAGGIGTAGTRQRLQSISAAGFRINLNNALTGNQEYFYLSLGN